LDRLKDKIYEVFGQNILNCNINNENELYLEVDPDKIVGICTYINTTLDLPLVSMFASDERSLIGRYGVYYVFSQRDEGNLLILKTGVDSTKMEIQSISATVPGAATYEREIKDLFGIDSMGHPDPKRLVFHSNWPSGEFPLRKEFEAGYKPRLAKEDIRFTKVEGEGVYEIPVGPVHAGIIEPGHFRFSVAGEPIINLEAQLYFVHKGVEKMCEGQSIEKCLYVAERISGDETFTNALAY